jgi:hypothetical protein
MSEQICRDGSRERPWLELAELSAGRSGFLEHALMRLAAGEHAYGNRWAHMGLDHLLRELTEEAADIGAWGVLALQALEHHPSAHDVDRIARQLHAALLWAAYAHLELVLARRELHAGHADGLGPHGRADGRRADGGRAEAIG